MLKKKLKYFFDYLCKTQTNMPVQTRSQTHRIAIEGEPHDLEAFYSYQEHWMQEFLQEMDDLLARDFHDKMAYDAYLDTHFPPLSFV